MKMKCFNCEIQDGPNVFLYGITVIGQDVLVCKKCFEAIFRNARLIKAPITVMSHINYLEGSNGES
jgi:hypothetical protein